MTGNWTAPAPHGSTGTSQVSNTKYAFNNNNNTHITNQLAKHPGPPYASTNAIVGGEPTPSIDDPIAAVLLLLFLLSAFAHLAILRINKQRNLKFVFSGMLFALCFLRGVSLAARMVWASYPKAVNAVIAASVMTQCGSVLIFIINLFFTQRVLRAYHPRLGWSRAAGVVVWFLIICVLCCLVMAIVTTIHSFFTLDRASRRADRAVQLFAGSYLACLAFLPVPIVALAAATHPRRFHVEKFGYGRWRAKIGLLVFAALVATLGAAFRVGVNFDGRPGRAPAWFHSRACYYGFNFVTDLVVSTAYLLARFDRRFIVPDGARGPGEYSPIIPSTHSNSSHLEGKLPLMGTSKPVIMLRQPSSPSVPPSPPFLPHTITMTAKMPSSSSSSQQHLIESFTDTTNTAVQNTPTTNLSLNRKDKTLHLTLKYHTHNHSYTHLHSYPHHHSHSHHHNTTKPRPKSALKNTSNPRPNLKSRTRTRRAALLRMRINSEADVYGPDISALNPLMSTPATHSPCGSREALVPCHSHSHTHTHAYTPNSGLRAPAAVHFVGPPILPDLDLDLELLSATLPWPLDSWGYDVRRSSRGGSTSGSGSGSGSGSNSSSSAALMSGTEDSGTSNSDSSNSSTDRSASSNSTGGSSGGQGQVQGERESAEAVEVEEGTNSGKSSGGGSQRSMRSWRSRTM
ncbi:uncharacterized protein GGS22DRAFT_66767 [Annulohypoxylon maeteangense]|uniref:uncharacterized protein n=1 Tax=Annulohypoxylon maeteangense TaxID=1927788 RepID=UPI0020084B16|nr:uncharacterized protein GGS22DRAFT_66767 [Annulohypoxylon maeteangense]KAI0889057.1 hypothetical protein GGS22DRAFT_66767 [Annulohypoxylon maeteangense]